VKSIILLKLANLRSDRKY